MEKNLRSHRDIWRQKEALRAIYEHWYRQMFAHVQHTDGITIELGGGIGNLKDFNGRIVSSDLERYEWLDLVNDAEALPFQAESISNIFLFDVLHHLGSPHRFFEETARVLRPGGRAIMIEPYISPVSDFVYTHFHPESHDLNADPFRVLTTPKNPLDSNQAYPTAIFWKHRAEFARRYPTLKIHTTERMGLFAYPLCGGFRHKNMLTTNLLTRLNKWEKHLKSLSPLFAFRCLVVLEKQATRTVSATYQPECDLLSVV
jgi:SAM-dependent methyltransferase